MNDDHDQALASLRKIELVKARWVLPGHGLPWGGEPAAGRPAGQADGSPDKLNDPAPPGQLQLACSAS